MTTPTMDKMLKAYMDAAAVERLKCGRPEKGTVKNTRHGVKRFVQWMIERRLKGGLEYKDLSDGFPLVSVVKPPLIHKYLADLLKAGTRPITAMTYVYQLRQLFSAWVRPYYEDHGWKVPQFPSFGKKPMAPRYSRPSRELLDKVKQWYRSMPTGELWFVTTMMLEFAMRNGDIMRLGRRNFVEREGRVFLNYTPNKTVHSSGRTVKWPVHPEIWSRIVSIFEGDDLPTIDDEIFVVLNQKMRELGFTGPKGAYELRKICVDHVYQKFGAEMAVSISGDDIKTITYYYADPAQPNIGDIRVTDLI